ncbi:esterase [Vibrio azureus]|uniref:Putative esterase n=1 Tax=Vibrio azureus NBRC 104587 TaxID=1219077 RepID=U3C922_9VIBR|nr:hotdog fold thioesterase [Vibrio azureus]AUI88182.1 esterase [Vibrio azureus]GAD74923.1 putative esterase [Vibrio azureus NBRC 104587]
MSIWTETLSLELLNATSKNTMMEHLQIKYTEFTSDTISATMPVCHYTHQPFGLLHGGASVVLAETLGSLAANCCVKEGHYCVGLEINANHIRSVKSGIVTGQAKPIHLGSTTQVWQIDIKNEDDQLVCTSRLTVAVKQRTATPK